MDWRSMNAARLTGATRIAPRTRTSRVCRPRRACRRVAVETESRAATSRTVRKPCSTGAANGLQNRAPKDTERKSADPESPGLAMACECLPYKRIDSFSQAEGRGFRLPFPAPIQAPERLGRSGPAFGSDLRRSRLPVAICSQHGATRPGSGRPAADHARQESELPIAVGARIREVLVAFIEVAGLERRTFGAARDAHDSAVRRWHEHPVDCVRHRVWIQSPEIADLNRGVRCSTEQLLQRLRIDSLLPPVAPDRHTVLVPDPEELRLALALRGRSRDLARGREHEADQHDESEQPDVGEAAGPAPCPLTTRHRRLRSRPSPRRRS